MIVVGLGNPGPEYTHTRHNLGYRVVEELARRFRVRFRERQFGSLIARAQTAGKKVVLAKPFGFMNRSGEAVGSMVERNNLNLQDILVVCDDFNLPLGQLRLRPKGSDGGHNGLRSVIDALGQQEFPRLRIGIGSPPRGAEQADYVLSEFAPAERPVVEDAVQQAADAVECWLAEGLDEAMNRFNKGAEQA